MVVFCCNGCGDTLKKQKVESHPYSCRSSISCIDCNVNFSGNDYKSHTQCVTEAQRYQGHMYQAKENKGALKQNSWMESVREAADNCKHQAQLKGLLVRIAENDNVPRKKAKFLNFIRNSMRVNNQNLVQKAWDEIEKAGKPVTAAKSAESIDPGANCNENAEVPEKVSKKEKRKKKGKENGTTISHPNETKENTTIEEEAPAPKQSKKRKREMAAQNENVSAPSEVVLKKKKHGAGAPELEPNLNHECEVEPATPTHKYKLADHIQQLVIEKEQISLKKLKRKVTAAFLEHNPHKSPEEASRLFDKKVTRVPGVTVDHGNACKA